MNMSCPPHHRASSAGFTLIEVLVSVVVLAVGLLGLAGLQVTGLKATHSASGRTNASQLALEISDRMRSNPTGVSAGAYVQSQGKSSDDDDDDSSNRGRGNGNAYAWGRNGREGKSCKNSSCSPLELSDYDLGAWNSSLSGDLPNGSGAVCLDSTPNDGSATSPGCDNNGQVYAIKIFWDDDSSGHATQRFVTSFQP